MNIILDLPPANIPKGTWVGIDTEIAGLRDKQLHRPHGKMVLAQFAIGDDVYVIQDMRYLQEALHRVKDCWWVLHNAKFDLTHMRAICLIKPRVKVFDTMIIERIIYGGYYSQFGLDDLARRYLDIYLEKELQKSFQNFTVTPEQIQYAARDAWVLPQIAEKQRTIMDKKDFYVWNEIDRPAMWAFMDFQGHTIDAFLWQKVAEANRTRKLEIDATLPCNPNSTQQVQAHIRSILPDKKYKIENGDADTLEGVIAKFPDTDVAKFCTAVLESKVCGKRASTYGFNYLEDYIEQREDGSSFIMPNYNVTKAETGRTSCDAPNAQNIPARDTKEFRKCFVARPGYKLLIGDYSQQEVFIAAYLSQDQNLIEACNSGKDIYIYLAKLLYNKDIEKSDPLRPLMKSLVLGMNYGMSAKGLAIKTGLSIDEAEELLDKFFGVFKGMAKWIKNQKKIKNKVETQIGRKVWLNPYSYQSERNSLNAPIQGSAGDCMKKALANIHQMWTKFDVDYVFPVVGYIHDELIAEVPENIAEVSREMIESIMVNTANEMFPGMKFRAEVHICNDWSEK